MHEMSEPVAMRTFGCKYEGEMIESFPDVEGFFSPLLHCRRSKF